MKIKPLKALVKVVPAVLMTAGWFMLSESTRRYLIHLGKQLPYLPYRYFI